jgi:hypothetical protein
MDEQEALRQNMLSHARYCLEKMADVLEAAVTLDPPMRHSYFVMAKAFGLTVRDCNGTALHSTGPWAGLSMVAFLMADVDLALHDHELPTLAKLVNTARCIPVSERPRGKSPEAKLFMDELEALHGRVTGLGEGAR